MHKVETAKSPEIDEVTMLRRRVTELEAQAARWQQLEETLREHEERFRRATEATSDAIYDWNLKTGSVWRSEGYVRLLHPPTSQSKRESWWETHLHPDDREPTLTSLHLAFARRERVWGCEYRFQRDDGVEMFLRDRATIEYDETGTPLRLIGAMSDITEQKRAEAQLRLSTERLEILRDIDFAILQAQSAEAIARSALPSLRRLVPCLRATVALFDWEHGASELLAADGAITLATNLRQTLAAFPQRERNLDTFRQGKLVLLEDLQAVAGSSPVLQAYYDEGRARTSRRPSSFRVS
jgi:hypothetical protein